MDIGAETWPSIVVVDMCLPKISPLLNLALQSFTRNENSIRGSARRADARFFRVIVPNCGELHAKFARGAGIWEDFKG